MVMKATLLIEPNGMSVCIQGDKAASRTIAMRELIFDSSFGCKQLVVCQVFYFYQELDENK